LGGSRSTTILPSRFCGDCFIVVVNSDQRGIETPGDPRVDGGVGVNVKALVVGELDPTNWNDGALAVVGWRAFSREPIDSRGENSELESPSPDNRSLCVDSTSRSRSSSSSLSVGLGTRKERFLSLRCGGVGSITNNGVWLDDKVFFGL